MDTRGNRKEVRSYFLPSSSEGKRHIDQLLENKGNEETSVMDDFEGV